MFASGQRMFSRHGQHEKALLKSVAIGIVAAPAGFLANLALSIRVYLQSHSVSMIMMPGGVIRAT